MIPTLRRKIDNIDLPSLEPIVYKAINFTYKEIGKFAVKDFRGFGISRAKVQNVKTVFKDNELMFSSDFMVPKILLTGLYKGYVSFNSFQLHPKGQFNITLKSVTGRLNIKVMTKTIDGEDYLHLYTFGITPTVKEIKFALTGIFSDPNMSKLKLIGVKQKRRIKMKFQINSSTSISTKTGEVSTTEQFLKSNDS